MSGRVIHGQKLGRTLGFPTANIALNRVNVPLAGVYVVRFLNSKGVAINGVANIGVKPTVGNFKPSLEVHLLDFKGDLYGERATVQFLSKIRDEQRFSGVEALTEQIQKDIDTARAYLVSKETDDLQ